MHPCCRALTEFLVGQRSICRRRPVGSPCDEWQRTGGSSKGPLPLPKFWRCRGQPPSRRRGIGRSEHFWEILRSLVSWCRSRNTVRRNSWDLHSARCHARRLGGPLRCRTSATQCHSLAAQDLKLLVSTLICCLGFAPGRGSVGIAWCRVSLPLASFECPGEVLMSAISALNPRFHRFCLGQNRQQPPPEPSVSRGSLHAAAWCVLTRPGVVLSIHR